MPLKATERDVYEFFSKAGKVCEIISLFLISLGFCEAFNNLYVNSFFSHLGLVYVESICSTSLRHFVYMHFGCVIFVCV